MDNEPNFGGAPVIRATAGVGVILAVADAVVAAQAGSPLAKVTVVVPTGIGLVRLRRDVAAAIGRRRGGVANLEVTTVAALTREQRGAEMAAAASGPAVLAALGRAAADVGGPLAGSAEQPATLVALAAVHREVREVGDAARRALAGRGRLAAAVAAVSARAGVILRGAGLADEAERIANCQPRPPGALVIVADGAPPRSHDALLHRLADAATSTSVVTVVTGDDPVAIRTADVSRVDVSRVDGGPADGGPADGGPADGGPADGDRAGRLHVSNATDPDAEVREAVRRLRRALLGGTDASRCALVWTADDPYRRLVTEHLDRAEIPWSGPAGGSLMESRTGRAALAIAADVAATSDSWAVWAAAVVAALNAPADPATARNAPADPADRTQPDAADPVLAVLVELGRLDRVSGFPASERLRRHRAASLLALTLGATPPRRGDRGVLVGPVGAAPTTLGYNLVAIVGVAEGWVPQLPGGGALLGDADRAATGLTAAADDLHRQRRRLFGLLAAGHEVHLSWPRGDLRRTVDRHASRWLPEVVTAARAAGRPVIETIQPSHLGSLVASAPAARADQRLALALVDPAALAGADERFARGRLAVLARRQPTANVYDGNLEGEDLAPLRVGRVWTASDLEQYLDCPRSFFLRTVLRVRDDDPVDELLYADARLEGTTMHHVLQTMMESERDGIALPRAARRAALARALDDAERVAHAGRQRPAPPVPELLGRHRRRELLGQLARILDEDRERRSQSGRRVALLECEFGTAAAPVTIALPSGRPLALRGRIDRVDRRDDASAVVVDYKRRSRPDGAHPLGGRGRLQVAVYAAAARDVFAVADVGAELVSITDGRVHVVGAATMADAAQLAELIVEGVEAGWFWPPQHPPRAPGVRSCPVCDPYGLFDRLLARRASGARP